MTNVFNLEKMDRMDHAGGSNTVGGDHPGLSKKDNRCKFLPVHPGEPGDKTEEIIWSSRKEYSKHKKDIEFLSFLQPGCVFIVCFITYKFFDKVNSVSAGNDKGKDGTDAHADIAINESHNWSEYKGAYNTGYESGKNRYYHL